MLRVPEHLLEHRTDDAIYHDGRLFTGTAFVESSEGKLLYEVGYREGRRWGQSREWYPDGTLSSESSFAWDWAHGRFRQWHGNGVLAEDERYEWGVLLSRKAWDEDGTLFDAFELSESDPSYKELQERRAKWGHVVLE